MYTQKYFMHDLVGILSMKSKQQHIINRYQHVRLKKKEHV